SLRIPAPVFSQLNKNNNLLDFYPAKVYSFICAVFQNILYDNGGNMSNWLSFQETLDELDIKDFELFEYLKKGLQPYNRPGAPFLCPSECHEYHSIWESIGEIQSKLRISKDCLDFIEIQRKNNDKKTILIAYNPFIDDLFAINNIPLKINNKGNMLFATKQISQLNNLFIKLSNEHDELEILQKNIVNEDKEAVSWKFYRQPDSTEDLNKIITDLEDKFFKSADVEMFKEKTLKQSLNIQNLKNNDYLSAPDPLENTVLNYWTSEEGTVLNISTVTNGNKDGDVSFPLNRNGIMTKQRIILEMLLCSNSVSVADIIQACYSDEMKDTKQITKIMSRVRSQISAIRLKKFRENGINPDILTPLGNDVSQKNKVRLRVKKSYSLDDRHFKGKNISSYKSSEDIKKNEEVHTDYLNKNIAEALSYDPDKHLNGMDDESLD
ncbi:hypothetical protein ACFL6P_08585, partial [Candidatus Latescibacterota bacterium]